MKDYWTLTQLGTLYDMTSHEIGKVMKYIGLRTPGGQPSDKAIDNELVREVEGPQPWITFWMWDRERVVPYLEAAGLGEIDNAETE